MVRWRRGLGGIHLLNSQDYCMFFYTDFSITYDKGISYSEGGSRFHCPARACRGRPRTAAKGPESLFAQRVTGLTDQPLLRFFFFFFFLGASSSTERSISGMKMSMMSTMPKVTPRMAPLRVCSQLDR